MTAVLAFAGRCALTFFVGAALLQAIWITCDDGVSLVIWYGMVYFFVGGGLWIYLGLLELQARPRIR